MRDRRICTDHRYAWFGGLACPLGNARCMVITTAAQADARVWWDLRMAQRSDADYAALTELSLALRDRAGRLPLLAQAVGKVGRVMRFEGAAHG